MADLDLDEFVDFLKDLTRLLIECGCSSNRIERLATRIGRSWGVDVDVLALSTGVWISARRGGRRALEIARVRDWSVDMSRLARLGSLVDAIEAHEVSIHDAVAILREEARAPAPYGTWLTLMAGAASSAVLVYLYDGTTLEIALAGPAGAFVQLLGKYLFVGENRRYLADFLSAAFIATYGVFVASIFPQINVPRLIVGGLITLIPGLVLVNAVHEIAQKNLVSGSAKLLESLVITGALTCGVIFIMGISLML